MKPTDRILGGEQWNQSTQAVWDFRWTAMGAEGGASLKADGKDWTPPEVWLEAGGEDRALPEAGQLAGEPVGPGTAGGKLWWSDYLLTVYSK